VCEWELVADPARGFTILGGQRQVTLRQVTRCHVRTLSSFSCVGSEIEIRIIQFCICLRAVLAQRSITKEARVKKKRRNRQKNTRKQKTKSGQFI
jgi:hypothetical protein